MRMLPIVTAALLMSTGYVLAGPGSGQPLDPADPASGRPAQIMDDAKCAEVWSLAETDGDTLSQGHAAPFIVNFDLVDVDGDGKISEAEFKDACAKGLVQEAAAPQLPSGDIEPRPDGPVQTLPDGGDAGADAPTVPLPQ
jgi:EF hand